MRKIFSSTTLRGYLYMSPVVFWTLYSTLRHWSALRANLCDPLSRQFMGCSTWEDLAQGLTAMLLITTLFFLLVLPLSEKPGRNIIKSGIFMLTVSGYAVWALFGMWHAGAVSGWQFGWAFGLSLLASSITGIELIRWMRQRRKAAEA